MSFSDPFPKIVGAPSNDELRTHQVKCWPEYYAAVIRGDKPFEVRKNDRDYRVGDAIVLNEWHPAHEAYTGRSCRFLITYVLAGGSFGIDPDTCVLGLGTRSEEVKP